MLRTLIFRQAALACLLAPPLALSGCGGGPRTVTATGTVVRNGQPIPLSKTGVIQITLQPDVGPDEQFTNSIGRADSSTGKFEIFEVPTGRYKVGIEVLDPTPQDDKLRGTLTANNSKIIREVDGKTPITIDLAKPE